MKYANAISPESTNATGRVNSPRVKASPPKTSRIPAIPTIDRISSGGWPGGIGGMLNSFIVPKVMKVAPVTMRRMLSIRLGQGDGAGSKIDMCTPLVLGGVRECRDQLTTKWWDIRHNAPPYEIPCPKCGLVDPLSSGIHQVVLYA